MRVAFADQAIMRPLGLAGTIAVARKMAEMPMLRTAADRLRAKDDIVIFSMNSVVGARPVDRVGVAALRR